MMNNIDFRRITYINEEHFHKITWLMSCVHERSTSFENEDFGCWSPAALD